MTPGSSLIQSARLGRIVSLVCFRCPVWGKQMFEKSHNTRPPPAKSLPRFSLDRQGYSRTSEGFTYHLLLGGLFPLAELIMDCVFLGFEDIS